MGVSGSGCMAAGAEGGVAKGDFYKSQLGEMQTTLGQIRVMLLARQASLGAGRMTFSQIARTHFPES